MDKNSSLPIFFKLAVLVILVIALSTVSVALWGGKSEKIMDIPELVIDREMTLSQFGQANNLANPVLKEVFGLQTKSDLEKTLGEFNLSDEQISRKVVGGAALNAEEVSKDWIKILIKFASWIIFLTVVFFLMRKSRITPMARKII